MYRILNSNVIGLVLAALSWIVIGLIVFFFVRVLTSGAGWLYLD
jgi:hypothetical protein